MEALDNAIARLREVDPQVRLEVIRGVSVRRKENGIPVLAIHYSADPFRDPGTPVVSAWMQQARAEYSSQSGWDREQEMDALAGGGERVFARVLGDQFHDTVIITDPKWMPDPRWDIIGGFDHGKTNATALEKAYIDFQGNVYFCGEYYSYAREGWPNDVSMNTREMLRLMPATDERRRWVVADPSIFDEKDLQTDGTYSSTNKTYRNNGVPYLRPFQGERSDLTFVERMLSDHWRDLEHRKPTVYIVCRNESDRLQPGLHLYDSPNLVWELNRTKRAQLTPRQMLTRNPTDNIIDRWNHARDAAKYLIMTLAILPKPTEVPMSDQIQQVVAGLNPTSAAIAAQRFYADKVKKKGKTFSYRGKARMR